MESITAKESKARKKRRGLFKKFFLYALLSFFGISMVTPFFWTLSTSLKEPGNIFTSTPEWIPRAKFIEKQGKRLDIRIREENATFEVLATGKIRIGRKNRIYAERPEWWNPFLKKYYVLEKRKEEEKEKPKKIYVKILKEKAKVEIIQEGQDKGKVLEVPSNAIKERVNPAWKNFGEAWRAIPFARGYINSLFVSITITLGQVFTSALAAYAFARLSFPGRDKLFLGYLGTMMIPGAVTMIPVFILLRKLPEVLNWIFHTDFWSTTQYLGPYMVGTPIGIDSYFALIGPLLFSAYGTFMLRQFFMTIPRDLEDAARIDGSGPFGTFFRIILPLSKPALATLTIFTFMNSWRSFLWPLIVTNSMEMKTIPVMIASFQGLYITDWHLLMAASLIALVPMLIVFIIGQRFFVEGIRLGAIKG